MNFANLTSLTIPEGNVTQITDASGRVIWSSAPPFDGFVYLRPSADISVDSTLTLVPADATAAYLLINEEVCDEAATTIGIIASSDRIVKTGEAIFGLAGNVPTRISRVTNIHIVTSFDANDSTYKGTNLAPYLIFNDTSLYGFDGFGFVYGNSIIDTVPAYEPRESSVSCECDIQTGSQIASVTTEDLLAKINEYVLANAQLPDIKLKVRMAVDTDADAKNAGELCLSQVYVVIECE